MSDYEKLMWKLAKEQWKSNRTGAVLLNCTDAEEYECLLAQFGGKELLREEFPELFKLAEQTREMHLRKAPERYLSRGVGLNDYIYIHDLGVTDSAVHSCGAATLTSATKRLYMTLTLYDGDKPVGRCSEFYHNTRRGNIQNLIQDLKLTQKHLTAILHVTWQDGTQLKSAAMDLTARVPLDEAVAAINVEHPRTNPGIRPVPVMEESRTEEVEAVIKEVGTCRTTHAREWINICYARAPVSGERCDYMYPDGLKDGKQNIYLDIRGNVELNNLQYDKVVMVDVALDTPYGGAMHQTEIGEKYFRKTENGFSFAFPTDWKTPIPGGKLAGREVCYLDVNIYFRCVGSQEDYLVKIKSQETPERSISYEKVIEPIKLNWGCMAFDTGVQLADGRVKEIKDICIGDRVMSGDGCSVEVRDIMVGLESMIWNIKAYGHEMVRATGSHPFVTREGIKLAEELMETDDLLMENGEYARIEYRFETYYGNMVYNLMFTEPQNIIANGYVVGCNETQQRTMAARAAEIPCIEDSQVLAEIGRLKEYMSISVLK